MLQPFAQPRNYIPIVGPLSMAGDAINAQIPLLRRSFNESWTPEGQRVSPALRMMHFGEAMLPIAGPIAAKAGGLAEQGMTGRAIVSAGMNIAPFVAGAAIGGGEIVEPFDRAAALDKTMGAIAPIWQAHSARTAGLAVELGKRLGMPEVEMRGPALLHDIGKLNIISRILEKPGPLTAEEIRAVGEHITGVDKLLGDLPQDYRDTTYHHHDWYDGSKGSGAAGEEIPLKARITTVADAFDAMVSDRSYRRGLPEEEALRRLEEGKGTQFDPRIVDAFVRMRKGIEELPGPGKWPGGEEGFLNPWRDKQYSTRISDTWRTDLTRERVDRLAEDNARRKAEMLRSRPTDMSHRENYREATPTMLRFRPDAVRDAGATKLAINQVTGMPDWVSDQGTRIAPYVPARGIPVTPQAIRLPKTGWIRDSMPAGAEMAAIGPGGEMHYIDRGGKDLGRFEDYRPVGKWPVQEALGKGGYYYVHLRPEVVSQVPDGAMFTVHNARTERTTIVINDKGIGKAGKASNVSYGRVKNLTLLARPDGWHLADKDMNDMGLLGRGLTAVEIEASKIGGTYKPISIKPIYPKGHRPRERGDEGFVSLGGKEPVDEYTFSDGAVKVRLSGRRGYIVRMPDGSMVSMEDYGRKRGLYQPMTDEELDEVNKAMDSAPIPRAGPGRKPAGP